MQNRPHTTISAALGRFAALISLLILAACGVAHSQDAPSGRPDFSSLAKTAQAALQAEKNALADLEKSHPDQQKEIQDLSAEIDFKKIELSSIGNLLLTPTTRIEDLEKAWVEIRATIEQLNRRLTGLNQKLDTVVRLEEQVVEQRAIARQQLNALKTEERHTPEGQALIGDIEALMRSQNRRVAILAELQSGYREVIAGLTQTRDGFSDLNEKFGQAIRTKKHADLFQRTVNPLISLGWQNIGGELELVVKRFRKIVSGEYWLMLLGALLASRGLLPVTAAVLYLLALILILRLRRFCRWLREKPFSAQFPWRRMVIRLLESSLPLLGTVVFFYLFFQAQKLFETLPLLQATFYFLLTLLFTGWGLGFIRLQSRLDHPLLPAAWLPHLKKLLRLVRVFAAAYWLLDGVFDSGEILKALARIAFETALLVWVFRFRPQFRSQPMPAVAPELWQRLLRPALSALAYVIFIGGVVLELAGYGALALYWFTSWGKIAVALFWGVLFFLLLREWDQRFYHMPQADDAPQQRKAQPFRWAVFRLCWLIWGGLLAVALVLAWSGTQAVFSGLLRVLRFPISFGAFSFNLMGFSTAALILFFTHLLARLCRHLMSTRVLARSGLEPGLQNSVISITVYLVWGLGVLVALNAFGVGGTSLTVAFGALSIGLGFGLQNIFNNFISGIILLFERPIQVGDAVEINGTWAEVKKINFRSTVVQTYDNASLIIPNSEFISSQVTNWSFRDLSLRIKISVGVAYGSDTELVRSSLLEIADRTPKVRPYPRPDVLFTDFGDSALIFVLRVWTDVD
ncbi:MAG TPA: mechanosensitive ion channel domain-containing protein, partial [Desulfobacterales bacterium]|nr:mechanosensitive ion channel domain-containing protein [Desulfobacterales bacterium]